MDPVDGERSATFSALFLVSGSVICLKTIERFDPIACLETSPIILWRPEVMKSVQVGHPGLQGRSGSTLLKVFYQKIFEISGKRKVLWAGI
jgi:hypothetical protein